MKYLTKKQIIMLHARLTEQTGGSPELRDDGLLSSAVSAPFQTFGGQELYPTLIEKAVRSGFGLIKNHPFADGNKRIGTHSMLVFLALNHIKLEYDDEELIDIIMKTAGGEKSEKELLEWVQQHIC